MVARLLDDVRTFVRRYVVLNDAQLTAVVLWAVHTHVIDAFEVTPFLAINSPEKRCGKTRLLDVLELVVARPWRTIMPSEAVLFRKIAAVAPTLMLDEVDAIFNAKNTNTEPLRAVLNAGNRRGTSVPRCVGPQQQLVDFGIFCPKALAGIGTLPDTITDRSVVIRMQRKRKDEMAERFRMREAAPEAEELHRRLVAWAEGAVVELEAARPAVTGDATRGVSHDPDAARRMEVTCARTRSRTPARTPSRVRRSSCRSPVTRSTRSRSNLAQPTGRSWCLPLRPGCAPTSGWRSSAATSTRLVAR